MQQLLLLYLTTFISDLLDLLQHHHYLGAVVYIGPVRISPNHGHNSRLLYLLNLHLHLRAAVLVEELRELGQEDHHSAQVASPLRLETSMVDEPEKIEMKVAKVPKIKLRSLPAAATAFSYFSLPILLLLVLRRYSSCFLFQWLWQI